MTSEAKSSRRWAAAAAPLVGLVIGYLAALIQGTFAPVGMFPLLIGVITGSVVGGFFFLAGGTGRSVPLISTAVATIVCLATLHYASFLVAKAEADLQAEAHRKAQQQIIQGALGDGAQVTNMPAIPSGIATFREYLGRQWDVGRKLGPLSVSGKPLLLWWILDGVLMLVGAAVTTALLLAPRRPQATSNGPTAARQEESA